MLCGTSAGMGRVVEAAAGDIAAAVAFASRAVGGIVQSVVADFAVAVLLVVVVVSGKVVVDIAVAAPHSGCR